MFENNNVLSLQTFPLIPKRRWTIEDETLLRLRALRLDGRSCRKPTGNAWWAEAERGHAPLPMHTYAKFRGGAGCTPCQRQVLHARKFREAKSSPRGLCVPHFFFFSFFFRGTLAARLRHRPTFPTIRVRDARHRLRPRRRANGDAPAASAGRSMVDVVNAGRGGPCATIKSGVLVRLSASVDTGRETPTLHLQALRCSHSDDILLRRTTHLLVCQQKAAARDLVHTRSLRAKVRPSKTRSSAYHQNCQRTRNPAEVFLGVSSTASTVPVSGARALRQDLDGGSGAAQMNMILFGRNPPKPTGRHGEQRPDPLEGELAPLGVCVRRPHQPARGTPANAHETRSEGGAALAATDTLGGLDQLHARRRSQLLTGRHHQIRAQPLEDQACPNQGRL